eukprot:scaffold12965_cov241-Isochrysis_galbana.AAC.8
MCRVSKSANDSIATPSSASGPAAGAVEAGSSAQVPATASTNPEPSARGRAAIGGATGDLAWSSELASKGASSKVAVQHASTPPWWMRGSSLPFLRASTISTTSLVLGRLAGSGASVRRMSSCNSGLRPEPAGKDQAALSSKGYSPGPRHRPWDQPPPGATGRTSPARGSEESNTWRSSPPRPPPVSEIGWPGERCLPRSQSRRVRTGRRRCRARSRASGRGAICRVSVRACARRRQPPVRTRAALAARRAGPASRTPRRCTCSSCTVNPPASRWGNIREASGTPGARPKAPLGLHGRHSI